jgi:hypothetical protein
LLEKPANFVFDTRQDTLEVHTYQYKTNQG